MLATRLHAVRRGLEDRFSVRARETRLLLGERSLDFFSGQDEGDEHGLAASAGFVGVRSGRQTGQAVAAIDQLFNCEEQDLILRYDEGTILTRHDRWNFTTRVLEGI